MGVGGDRTMMMELLPPPWVRSSYLQVVGLCSQAQMGKGEATCDVGPHKLERTQLGESPGLG